VNLSWLAVRAEYLCISPLALILIQTDQAHDFIRLIGFLASPKGAKNHISGQRLTHDPV
jgi:hypothetical protein